MAQSKNVYNPSTSELRNSQFGSEKVLRWIQDSNSTSYDNYLPNSQEDLFADSEWSSQSQSENHGVNLEFVVPMPPIAKPKRFTPIVITRASSTTRSQTHSQLQSSTINRSNRYFNAFYNCHFDYSYDSSDGYNPGFNPSRCDLNASFESQTTNISDMQIINTSFQNVNNCLEILSIYCDSIETNRQGDSLVNGSQQSQAQSVQVDDYFYEQQTAIFNELPKRPFNEQSIDMTLPFTDIPKFITLVNEENQLFLNESNINEYIDSQLLASQADLSVKVVTDRNMDIDDAQPKHVQMLQKGLNMIFKDTSYKSINKFQKVSMEITNDRAQCRIREIYSKLHDDIKNRKKPAVEVRNTNDWKNMVYEDGILSVKRKEISKYSRLKSRSALVLYMLRKIYGLLVLNTQLTKRSIYYQLKSLMPRYQLTQADVNYAINIVSCMVDTPLWNLNVLSTSKGLVYGDLTLTIGNTEIQCKAQNGTSIPMDLNDLQKVESSAYFILIVEKDTVFQKLLTDDLPNKLSRNFILITGKGYADVATRRFLHILWKLLEIPMFIVVDADAYGIEIFLSYKFGSKNTSFLSEHLSLPTLKWLGVFPSELNAYKIRTLPLSGNDVKKLRSILTRPYFDNGLNITIKKEIDLLIKNKKKCEIEGLFQSNRFFANSYLPNKFFQRDFI